MIQGSIEMWTKDGDRVAEVRGIYKKIESCN